MKDCYTNLVFSLIYVDKLIVLLPLTLTITHQVKINTGFVCRITTENMFENSGFMK